jgi:phosphoglycerol geranylgeranyltransferase
LDSTYKRLLALLDEKRAGFMFLVDPDKTTIDEIPAVVQAVARGGCDVLLVGGSLLFNDQFEAYVGALKKETDLPVIIFPGSSRQVAPQADAILYLSLISSRNPHYLIGEQVLAAPIIRKLQLETIATGYMHVESGNMTTVEFLSGSRPIPRDKHEIAVAHGLAAEFLGMQMIYLEAGSGARLSPPEDMIRALAAQISIPQIVGGGIRTPDEARAKVEAGARFVVIGNVLEDHVDESEVGSFARAIHGE